MLRLRIRLRLVVALLSGSFLLLNVAFAAYGSRVLPGVRVAGVDIGGLAPHDASARLVAATRDLGAQTVAIEVGGRRWTASNAALGINADVDAAVALASRFGHEADPASRLGAWLDALMGGVDLPLPRRSDGPALSAFLGGIAHEIDRAPVDGSIESTSQGFRIIEPVAGVRFAQEDAAWRILSGADLDPRRLRLEPSVTLPAVDAEGMREARAAAIAASAPLRITVGSESVLLEPAQLAAVVRIERVAAGASTTLRARVDEPALDALVGDLAAGFDRQVRDAGFRSNGVDLAVVPSQDGVVVDRADLRGQLARSLFAAADGERIVQPAVSIAPASYTAENAAQVSLLSEFTTFFPANAARATNIRLAAARFDGVRVDPHASFSFWERIGEITYEAGFVDAGAIINGRSDKALAGGICQISTTFFNAVARAGYQLDERHAHAYYIERYPIGLDAAVFFPSEDFRWTNDTDEAVYIVTSAAPTSVTFKLFGIPTGRTVTFADPIQRNFVDPTPDQAADPAYPAGYVVRGRDVVASRTVTTDRVVVHQDRWVTRYQPVWGGPATSMTYR